MSDENQAASGCCGCLSILFFGPLLIVFILYLFSAGSISAVKNVTLEEIRESCFAQNCSALYAILPGQRGNEDKLGDLLSGNKRITKLEMKKVKPTDLQRFFEKKYPARSAKSNSEVANFWGSELKDALRQQNKDLEELSKYFDFVVVSFTMNDTMHDYVFMVLKGQFWRTLYEAYQADQGRPNAPVRPWAQYFGLMFIVNIPLSMAE